MNKFEKKIFSGGIISFFIFLLGFLERFGSYEHVFRDFVLYPMKNWDSGSHIFFVNVVNNVTEGILYILSFIEPGVYFVGGIFSVVVAAFFLLMTIILSVLAIVFASSYITKNFYVQFALPILAALIFFLVF